MIVIAETKAGASTVELPGLQAFVRLAGSHLPALRNDVGIENEHRQNQPA